MIAKQERLVLAPVTTPPERSRRSFRHAVPNALFALAAVLFILSLLLPFWTLTLHAPQYPQGLSVTLFTTKITGDVGEIDGLNHYIGMMKLGDAANLERQIAPIALAAIGLLGLLAVLLRGRWAALLALPIVVFPAVFAADLFYWLYRAGHNLDPHAALSTSIKPFTPHLLGLGKVGQFSTTAHFGAGFYLGMLAAVCALVGIVLRFRRRHA